MSKVSNSFRCCVLLMLGVVCCGESFGGMNVWTTRGPPGGNLTVFAISPIDPNVAYAAYSTTLYKSVDGGANWHVLRELHSIPSAMFLDPSDGNRFYLAAPGEGILRSDDAGQNYQNVSPDAFVYALGGNSGVLYYSASASGTPVFKRSTNGGASWQTIAPPPTFLLSKIVVDLQNSNIVIGLYNGAAVRSDDGGATWSTIALPGASTTPYANNAIILSATIMMISADDGVYRSVDGGASWVRVFNLHSVDAFAIDPSAANTIVAAGNVVSSRGQLIRSTNNGVSWTSLATAPLGTIEAIGVRLAASAQLLIANDQGVQRSSNNGATWTEAATQPGGSNVTRLVSGSANSRVFAVTYGRESGIFSTSIDSPWQRIGVTGIEALNGGLPIGDGAFAVKPGSPNYHLFLPRGRQGFYSQNGGTTWLMSGGSSMAQFVKSAVAFDPSAPNVVYASVQPDLDIAPLPAPPLSGIYRSLDSGVTWTPHSTNLDPNVNGQRLVIDPRNSSRMFLAARSSAPSGGISGLYRSVDSGVTWTRTLDGEDVRGVAVSPVDSNRIFVATSSGLQVSTNGGATFLPNAGFASLAAEQASAVAIDPLIPTTLYAASQNPVDRTMPLSRSSTILRSVDDGLTWETLRKVDDDPEWLVGHLVLDPSRPSLIYADTEFRGVGAFEIAPDLEATILGHSGSIQLGVPSAFSVRLENEGANAATNVRAVISLPAGLIGVTAQTDRGTCSLAATTLTCTVAALRALNSMTVQVSYVASTAMTLPISVVLSAHERDSNPANNSATATAVVGEVVDLAATVTASAQSASNGDALSFTVVARNNGPGISTNSTVTVTPGTGLSFGTPPVGCVARSGGIQCDTGTLAVNAQRSFSVQATATSAGVAAVGVSIVPTAQATDTIPGNNTASATVAIVATGDLSVTIVDSVDPAIVSTNFEYRAFVNNLGPDAMTNVVATLVNSGTIIGATTTQGSCSQSLSGMVCNLGTIASSGEVTISVVSGSSSAGSVSLQAVLTYDGVDRVSGNNSAQEFTRVVTAQGQRKSGGSFAPLDLEMLLTLVLSVSISRRLRNTVRAL